MVDDHKIFLESLAKHINTHENIEVKCVVDSCEALFDYLNRSPEQDIDILLLDLKLKGMSGLKCLEKLKEEFPSIRTIILSMFNQSPFIHEALRKGALSFITKDSEPDVLLQAIESVYKNGYFVHESLSKILMKNISDKQNTSMLLDPQDHITETQLEVLQYLCQGYTADEIGKILCRSKRTVEGHRQRLIENLDVKNTAALVAWAFREGIVS